MAIKCPNCGAGVDDGNFCKYCGAKLPDDTQHIEVSGTVDHNVNWVNKAKIARIEKAAAKEQWERENYDKLQKQKSREELKGLIGAVLFLIIFGGGLALLFKAVR